jgi:small subunit ribosomal protein S8
MITDPISDMLTRIRNASVVGKRDVDVPMSKIKFALAKVLESEGYFCGVELIEGLRSPMIRIHLKYDNKKPKISMIKRVSKPGRRIYVSSGDIKSVRSGYGVSIISTPNGLMTNKEAKKRHLGGEILCEIF